MATKLICDRCGKETDKLYFFESKKLKDITFDSEEIEYNISKELCPACQTVVWETINARFSV